MRNKGLNLKDQSLAFQALTKLLTKHIDTLKRQSDPVEEKWLETLDSLLKLCSLDSIIKPKGEMHELQSSFEDTLLEIESRILRLLLHPYEGLPEKQSSSLNDVVESSCTELVHCLGAIRRYHYLRNEHCNSLMPFFGREATFSETLDCFLSEKPLQYNKVMRTAHEEEFLKVCSHFIDNPENITAFYFELLCYQKQHRPNAEGSPRLQNSPRKEKNFPKLLEYIMHVKNIHSEHMLKLHVLSSKNPCIHGLLYTLQNNLACHFKAEEKERKKPILEKIKKINKEALDKDCLLTQPHKLKQDKDAQKLLKRCFDLQVEIDLIGYCNKIGDELRFSPIY